MHRAHLRAAEMEIDVGECVAVKFTRLIPGVVGPRLSEPQCRRLPPPFVRRLAAVCGFSPSVLQPTGGILQGTEGAGTGVALTGAELRAGCFRLSHLCG